MKILIVFGTRPEAIKMAPLVKLLRSHSSSHTIEVCVTAQHREMLDQVLSIFDIEPEYDLDIMMKGQDLYDVTSRVLLGLRSVLSKSKPDLVLVHGDTTTSVASALAAFYERIAVGHVEAGLRTNNIYSPWPEEMNRQITSRIASYHFAPTEVSKMNLIREGIDESKVFVTGNTVIDALHWVIRNIESDTRKLGNIDSSILSAGYDIFNRINNDNRRLVLITGHRRENFGEGFVNICKAIKILADKYRDVDFLYPMHLNPNVRNPIREVFHDESTSNVFFIEPQEYLQFVRLMSVSTIVLTDSGGIQEEAPGLGKPVLVMRDTTERPEAISAGTVRLVGTTIDNIVNQVSLLLDDANVYQSMSSATNPYGDGTSSDTILEIINKIVL